MKKKANGFWLPIGLLGVLLLPLIFIGGVVLGLSFQTQLELTADSISSWVAALATVAIAVLTFILAMETWRLRAAQIEQIEELRREALRPNVEFYLLPAPASFQFINVHIENNGKGAAKNIKFEIKPDAIGENEKNERQLIAQLLSLNMLHNGVASLGSGKERRSFVFSFIEYAEKMGDAVFNIKVSVAISYEDVEGREYKSESLIDFSEFKGISEIGGGDPNHNIYKEIEKIRKVLEGSQTTMTSKRININTYSSEDRDAEREAMRRRFESTDD